MRLASRFLFFGWILLLATCSKTDSGSGAATEKPAPAAADKPAPAAAATPAPVAAIRPPPAAKEKPAAAPRKDLPDCSQGSIPGKALAASIAGVSFKPAVIRFQPAGTVTVNDKTLDEYGLTLATDEGDLPKRSAEITILVPGGQPPDGKTFRAIVGTRFDQPSVPGSDIPQVQGWTLEDHEAEVSMSDSDNEGSLRLEFGKRSGKSIPVKLHWCVAPGKAGFGKTVTRASELTGTFAAKL